MTMPDIATAATALFVPGHRSDRYARAAASGAGFAIIDLEDAVPAESKHDARDAAVSALSDRRQEHRYAVRINAVDDGGVDDAHALAGTPGLLAVMVPKAEHGDGLRRIDDALGGRIPLLPLVETAAGLGALNDIARAPRVARLAFGAYDFAADIGTSDPRVLDHSRIALVLASRQEHLRAPLDSPDAEFRDLEVVRRGARNARALGFTGKLCIHPAQLEVAGREFLPSLDEVEWAQRVLAAQTDGATSVDGAMVDRPVRLRAEAILARQEGL